MDSEDLQGCLLKSREDSKKLCISANIFIDWLSNHNPPGAAHQEFMSGRLISLDKRSGACLVGVRETWWYIFDNCVLRVTVPKATNACQDEHICSGLNVVIDGVVQWVKYIWNKKLSTEYWGFLLVDANNALNVINWILMLWTVWHLWPSWACFFSCYRHWSLIVLQNGNGMASFLHSMEDVMQGDPLYMVTYGIGVLPLIKCLKVAYPDFTQPWYVYHDGGLGTFDNIGSYFNSLKPFGPGRG